MPKVRAKILNAEKAILYIVRHGLPESAIDELIDKKQRYFKYEGYYLFDLVNLIKRRNPGVQIMADEPRVKTPKGMPPKRIRKKKAQEVESGSPPPAPVWQRVEAVKPKESLAEYLGLPNFTEVKSDGSFKLPSPPVQLKDSVIKPVVKAISSVAGLRTSLSDKCTQCGQHLPDNLSAIERLGG